MALSEKNKRRLPRKKVAAGAGAGAAVSAVVSLLADFGVEVPAEAVGPIVTLISLAAGYFTKS
jgi:hypothetical protein